MFFAIAVQNGVECSHDHWSSSGDQTGAKPTMLNMGSRDSLVPLVHAYGIESNHVHLNCVNTLLYRVCACRCAGVGSMIMVWEIPTCVSIFKTRVSAPTMLYTKYLDLLVDVCYRKLE